MSALSGLFYPQALYSCGQKGMQGGTLTLDQSNANRDLDFFSCLLRAVEDLGELEIRYLNEKIFRFFITLQHHTTFAMQNYTFCKRNLRDSLFQCNKGGVFQ